MTEVRVSRLPEGSDWLKNYGEGSYSDRLHRLSHDTAGLTLIGIEDLLQEASAGRDRGLSRDEVMRLKGERLRQESQGLIEVLEPRRSLKMIGGYEELKARLREVVASLSNSHDELAMATVPMGILFLGPPGTGKSIVAEALAGESHVSLAKLGDFPAGAAGVSAARGNRGSRQSVAPDACPGGFQDGVYGPLPPDLQVASAASHLPLAASPLAFRGSFRVVRWKWFDAESSRRAPHPGSESRTNAFSSSGIWSSCGR